jgi:dTDP-4-dehydrorhamnose 3,5-epimerase
MDGTKGLMGGATRDRQSITADWTPVGRTLIDGVRVIEIRSVPKRGGFLTEVVRADWLNGSVVGHVFQVTLPPGAVSAWHVHCDTTDRLFVMAGHVTLALYDARQDAATFGSVNEFELTIQRPQLVEVPPGVWHGLAVGGTTPAIILNLPDRPYAYEAPDHWRLPPDTNLIPYSFFDSQSARARDGRVAGGGPL